MAAVRCPLPCVAAIVVLLSALLCARLGSARLGAAWREAACPTRLRSPQFCLDGFAGGGCHVVARRQPSPLVAACVCAVGGWVGRRGKGFATCPVSARHFSRTRFLCSAPWCSALLCVALGFVPKRCVGWLGLPRARPVADRRHPPPPLLSVACCARKISPRIRHVAPLPPVAARCRL